ncbi:MAG: hypothetical protein AAF899_18960 [Pseudomonadota bacterium]
MADYRDEMHAAVAALIEARHSLDAEISAYPTPISACDAQFNGMIADRRRLATALQALEAHVHVPTPRMPDPWSRIESR